MAQKNCKQAMASAIHTGCDDNLSQPMTGRKYRHLNYVELNSLYLIHVNIVM